MGPGDAFARGLGSEEEDDKGPGDAFSLGGAIEAAATFIPKQLAGGLGGAARAVGAKLGGATNKEASEEFMGGYEEAQKPTFFYPKATEYQQKAGEVFNKVTEKAGEFAEEALEYKGKPWFKTKEDLTGMPSVRGAAEVGANLYLGKKMGDAVEHISRPKAKVEEASVTQQPQAMGPGDAWKADMLGTEQVPAHPDVVDQMTTQPGGLLKDLPTSQEEMIQNEAQAGREGQPQSDLFQTTQEDLARRTSDAQPSSRDRSEPIIGGSQDREGNAPGVYPETQPRGEFQSREPTRPTAPASVEVPPNEPSVKMFKDPEIKSGENAKIEYITAKEYSDLVGPFKQGPENIRKRIDKEHGMMAKGEKMETPWIELDKDGKVTDHDGHHRAKAIEERFGPDAKIPVKVIGKNSAEIPDLNTRRLDYTASHNEGLKHWMTSGAETGRKGFEVIRDTTSNPYYKELATKLLEDKEFNPKFELREGASVNDRPFTPGQYSPSNYLIRQASESAGSEEIYLHEGIHARTHSTIQGVLDGEKRFEWAKPMVYRLNALYNSFLHEATKKDFSSNLDGTWTPKLSNKSQWSSKYGLTNIHEFVAEAFSNPEFQSLLKSVELPKQFKDSFFKNYWNAFMDNVSKLMGFDRNKPTYLEEVMKAGTDIMEGTDSASRRYYENDISKAIQTATTRFREPAPVGAEPRPYPVKSDLEQRGHMEVMKEAARDFALDRRPIERVVTDDLQGKKFQDFTDKDMSVVRRLWDRTKGMVKDNLLQDRAIQVLTKDRPGTGPLVKWSVDQVARIERDQITRTKEMLQASLYPFRKEAWSKAGRADMISAWKVWKENIGIRDLSRLDFSSERGFRAYTAFQKVTDRILNMVNDARVKAGFKPIERIPSFFHAGWEGDYRVFAYDAAGEKKWASGHKTEFEAESFKKDFEKKHPDLRVEWQHKEMDKYGIKDLSAFEDAVRVMGKDDPVTSALLKTAHEISSKRGFGRTAVYRKGVAGWLGQQDGFLGLRNMEQSFEQYVHQANRYVANLEKQGVRADLFKIPNEIRQKIPETMKFLHEYIDKAHGKIYFDAIDSVFADMTKAMGLGANAPMKMIHGMSQWASLVWLTTPRFLLSQTVQSMNAIPKLIQEHGTVSGYKAWFDGVSNAVSPDAIAKTAVAWATKRGYLDPTIKTLVGGDLTSKAPIGSMSELVRELAATPGMAAEHYMVRLPAFLAFEKALRGSIKDPETRFSEAAEKADYYMVNYGRTHSAKIYDKIGLFGEAARPLKQYSHQYIGAFFEYAADAKKGNIAPLANFTGIQILTGGLKGALFVAEATAAISLINYFFDTDIDTPERLLMKSHLPDSAVFGFPSTLLGSDISSSVGAPGLKSMFSFPPIEFTIDMIHDVGTYMLHKAQGIANDQDALRAAMAVTPNFMHETLRNIWTQEGQPTANPNDPQLRGNYTRDDSERLWAALTGAKPINEAKADMLIRNVKQVLMRDAQRKMDSLDAISDSVQAGKGISSDLIQRFLRDGGDPSRLSQLIAGRIKDRALTGEQREEQVGGSVTIEQMHKLDRLFQNMPAQNPEAPMGFDPKDGRLIKMNPDGTFEKIADTSKNPGTSKPRRFMDQNVREDPGNFRDNIVNRVTIPEHGMDQDREKMPRGFQPLNVDEKMVHEPPQSRFIRGYKPGART